MADTITLSESAAEYGRFLAEFLSKNGGDVQLSFSACFVSEPTIDSLTKNIENLLAIVRFLGDKGYTFPERVQPNGSFTLRKLESIEEEEEGKEEVSNVGS